MILEELLLGGEAGIGGSGGEEEQDAASSAEGVELGLRGRGAWEEREEQQQVGESACHAGMVAGVSGDLKGYGRAVVGLARMWEVTWVLTKSRFSALMVISRVKKKRTLSLNSVPKLTGNQTPSGWGA